MRKRRLILPKVLAFTALACGSPSGPSDAGQNDSGLADSGIADSGNQMNCDAGQGVSGLDCACCTQICGGPGECGAIDTPDSGVCECFI